MGRVMSKDEIHRKRWYIWLMVVSVTFASCIDTSSLNVALPVIADELNISMAQVELVVTLNLITIISLILSFGRLGDIKGKDRIFTLGIGIFFLGSLISFFSYRYEMLLIGRIVTGMGAAMTMALNQGIIAEVFSRGQRGKALGMNGSLVALGTMLGPAVGGFMTDSFGWNSIFLLNIPICLVDFFFCLWFLPHLEGEKTMKIDIKGSIVFAVFIISLYLSIKFLQNGQDGYLQFIGLLVFALIVGWLFYKEEVKNASPMLDFSLFKTKLFTVSVFCSFLAFFAISSNNFIMPFYLQKVLGFSVGDAGHLMMIYPLMMVLVAPLSGALSDKIGSEVLGVIGLSLGTVGLGIMSFLGENSSVFLYIIGTVVMALGFSTFQSPNTALIMSTVPPNKTGAAGSLNGLTRNLGNIFGISISTAVLYNLMSMRLGYMTNSFVEGRADVFVFGMRGVYFLAMGLAAVGLILSIVRLKSRNKTKTENK